MTIQLVVLFFAVEPDELAGISYFPLHSVNNHLYRKTFGPIAYVYYFKSKNMKQAFIFFISVAGLFICVESHAQDKQAKADSLKPSERKYEMKQYFFVMLIKGENRSQDSVTAAKIQEGHMKNIQKMADMGKLLVAGPFGDDGNWRGVFIMDCKTKEEAEELVKQDPAIISGRLKYEIHPWWTAKNCVFK